MSITGGAEVVQVITVQGGYVDQIVGKQVINQYATPSPAERERALRALLHDHSGFIASRMEAFVGRETELQEIHQRIAEKLVTGGYVTITGQAGQGKSSVIAKLVADAIGDLSTLRERLLEPGTGVPVCHFIPFSPGPDHQIGLLRNLIARLCLTYGLPDFYAASDSRPALRDYFAAALRDLAKQGKQEVIYIDGLDQIEEDASGVRDLSFLPEEPPEGIVFVLGTRPNDTLKPLTLRKPQHEYWLPALSRADFDLILAHRGVSLTPALADRFYAAMQENALYLDLVARELAQADAIEPEQIIAKVADDPASLFSLSIERLQRNERQWESVLRPILGLLLATRTPLSQRALRALIGADDLRTRKGLERLGGLIQRDGEGRYGLFHLKLGDFLRQEVFADDEEERCHYQLVSWCEDGKDGIAVIWQDAGDALEQERRAYARQHYVAHLAAARSYERLWAVIDAGEYGREKRKYDPSTRSYALDLDIARQAVIDEAASDQDAQARGLPRLWRYSLLRCSLTSHADLYPEGIFLALVHLNRANEALDLAELLSNAKKKVQVLLVIGVALHAYEPDHGLHALLRARTVAEAITNAPQCLAEVVEALYQVGCFDQAQEIAESLPEELRDMALSGIAQALAHAGQTERARRLATPLQEEWRSEALRAILVALILTGTVDQASALVQSIPEIARDSTVLRDIAVALGRAGWFGEAQRIIESIANPYVRADTLISLAEILIAHRQDDQVEPLLASAQALAKTFPKETQTGEFLVKLAGALAQAGHVDLAIASSGAIVETRRQLEALNRVVLGLTRAGQFERARTIADTIVDLPTRVAALTALASVLYDEGQQQAAARAFDEAQAIAEGIRHTLTQASVLRALATALSLRLQFQRARKAVNTISDILERVSALSALASQMARAGNLHEATQALNDACARANNLFHSRDFAYALDDLAKALAYPGQFDQTRATIEVIQDKEAREDALRAFAEALAHAGQFDCARTVADFITDAARRARTLSIVAKALTIAGHVTAAEEMFTAARAAANHSHREGAIIHVLSALAKDLVSAGYTERAAETVAAARDALRHTSLEARRSAIQAISEAQVAVEGQPAAQTGSETLLRATSEAQPFTQISRSEDDWQQDGHTQPLALTQATHVSTLVPQLTEIWRRTQTRDVLLESFTIDAVLFRAYPELGEAFLGSFTWVDSQLDVG